MADTVKRYFPSARRDRAESAAGGPSPAPPAADIPREKLNPTRTKLCHRHDYPETHDRPRGAYPSTVEKYERYEELAAAAGTGGTFADIGAFSGTPDAIDLVATGGDALVSLRDHAGREESSLRLIANVPRETHLSRRRVFAVNVSDAAAATVRATGKWASDYTPDAE
jgi:hypothetical protein